MESHKYSLKEIEHAYHIAANVVKLHGDAYLPIFERMHCEMQLSQKQQDSKSLALQIAGTLEQLQTTKINN